MPRQTLRKLRTPQPILLNRLLFQPSRLILPANLVLTLSVEKFLGIGTSDAPPPQIVKDDGNPLAGKIRSPPVSRRLIQIQREMTDRNQVGGIATSGAGSVCGRSATAAAELRNISRFLPFSRWC